MRTTRLQKDFAEDAFLLVDEREKKAIPKQYTGV